MEPPTAANDHNFRGGSPHSIPQGPVLYVTPLRMMPPSGGLPFFRPQNPQGPFNGFTNDMFRQSSHPESYAQAKRFVVRDFSDQAMPGSSTVRDFPVETGRNANARDTAFGNAFPDQQANVTEGRAAHPSANNPHAEPAGAPDATPKNSKRNNTSSTPPNPKRAKRSGAKPSKPVSTPVEASHCADPRKAVQATLRLYDSLRRNLLQEEEIKGKDAFKGRADLYAGSVVNSRGLSVNRNRKVVGLVPGIEVGDQFYFRMEICCVGLHGPIQGGIEYLTTKESEWNTPVAISIISAGGYDARDDGEVLVYTGQGGKSSTDKHKAIEDQKLERGNLAMEGSMKFNIPVRVIRGIKDSASPSGKVYTFDGLYKVAKCWSEKGKDGFEEFKFRLERLPGQPELGSAVIKLSNHLKQKPSMRVGLRMDDISKGKENMPVCVVNTVDDEQCPASFEYSLKVQYPTGFAYHEPPVCCQCKSGCSASKACPCFLRNGDEFAYLNSGVLVKEKDILYECGGYCTCLLACRNRNTQKGLKYRMEVFKTDMKGWGLRSWESIPAGSFVCEYIGKVINIVQDSEIVGGNEHVLNVKKLSKC
eukprot:c27858_g3_i1 orf=705-2471(+)